MQPSFTAILTNEAIFDEPNNPAQNIGALKNSRVRYLKIAGRYIEAMRTIKVGLHKQMNLPTAGA